MATVPTVPLIVVRPKATSQTLEFYWRPPVSDGGSAITGFILTDGTLTYTITGNPGYYKATGLTNGQSYSFTLAAVNGVGTGPVAPFRSVEPGNKPQPPVSVSYTDQGSGNVVVNWTNPANIGGTSRLLGMLVRAYRLDTNSNINLSSLSSVVSIWGGAANGTYTYPFYSLSSSNDWQFQVQLQNDPGRTLRTMGFTSSFQAVIPFSPSSFSTMQLWLDASDATKYSTNNTSNVVRWDSKGPVLISLSSIVGKSGGTFPLLSGSTIAGKDTFIFTSTSLLRQGTIYNSTVHMFWIGLQGTQPSAQNAFLFGADGTFDWHAASNKYIDGTGEAGINNASTFFLGNNSNSSNSFVNTQFASTNTTFMISAYSITGNTRWQGLTYDRNIMPRGWVGNLGEVITYSNALNVLQRQTVEGYLAWRWGISTLLPSWHPFYYRKPLVTDSNLDFSPSSLGGTQVWLDAADTTTILRSGTTSTMVTWNDKSGRGNNATAVNNPVYVPNDSSVFFNSASSQYFTLSNGAFPFSNSSYSYYMAVQFSTFTDRFNVGLLGGGVSNINNNSFNLRGSGDAGRITTFWWNNDLTNVNTFSLNQRTTVATYYSTNSTRNIRLNYQSTATDTPGIRTQPNTNNTLGRTTAGEHLFGRIHEVLVFSTLHSEFDRQRIEGYLAWKWGNQSFLPPSHLYYFRPPTRLDTFSTVGTSTILGPIASS